MDLKLTIPVFERALYVIDSEVCMMVQSLKCICPLVNIFLVSAWACHTSQFSIDHSAYTVKFIII